MLYWVMESKSRILCYLRIEALSHIPTSRYLSGGVFLYVPLAEWVRRS